MNSIFLSAEKSAEQAGGILDEIVNTAIIGFGMVFLILALIWGILEIFGAVARASSKKHEKTKDKEKASSPVTPQEPEASISDSADDSADDSQTVAAIMAAISAYIGKPLGSFRVVSFRRNGTKQ